MSQKIYAVYRPDGVIQAITHTNADLTFDDVDGELDLIQVPDEYVDAEKVMIDVKTKKLKERPPRPPKPEHRSGPPEQANNPQITSADT